MTTVQPVAARPETAAIPESANAPDPANVLEARFKAWKNLVDDLESYFKQLEKTHEGTSKDYTKLAKTLNIPFKDRGVFEQSGIQDIFSGLQSNATKLSNDHQTYAKSTDTTLVKSAKHLQSEIKDFIKRLEKDGVKGGKTVSKTHSDTQKQIELLGTHISRGSSGGISKANEDPYITHRGVLSRLDGQVQEENAHHKTLLALQNECGQFESKIVKSIQDMVSQMGSQAAQQGQSLSNSHQQLVSRTSQINPSHEWNGFVKRDRSLADPNAPARTARAINFHGADHELTKPVIEGDLLRKGTVIKKYNSAYYVLTQAGFLHEFKSKSYETDPEPSWSLDIKTCAIGGHSAPNTGKAKWTISGKSKGLISQKHDFQFQATSYDDMVQWWTAIRKFAASSPNVEEVAADDSDSESPVSPTAATATATPSATTASHPAVDPTTHISAVPAGATSHAAPVATSAEHAQTLHNASAEGPRV